MKTIISRVREWRDRLSLGQQTAILLISLCVVVILACVNIAADIAHRQAAGRAGTQLSAFSRNIAVNLDRFIDARLRIMSDITRLKPLVPVFEAGGAPLREMLDDLKRSHPELVWIGFAAADGTIVAATGGLLEGRSVTEREWFADGQKGLTLGDVHPALLLADLLPEDGAAEPPRLFDLAVPVVAESGRLIGVLGAHLSVALLDERRTSVLATLEPDMRNDLWILRADGRALSGPAFDSTPLPAERIAQIGAEGTALFLDETGPATITAAARMDVAVGDAPLGWIVVARRPLDAAYADANALSLAMFGVGAAIAILASLLSILLARRLTRPLQQLADQVDRIGRTPNAHMIDRERGSSDIRQLSTSIRALLRRLGTAEDAGESARQAAAQLQKNMEERTRRLGERISNLQLLADTDPLTQLLNRRAFLTFAQEAMVQFNRNGDEFGVLVIDIDHFKRVNDTYGHAVGDDVITLVGQAIEQEVRQTDKVARFGGEEFVVLLRQTDQEGVEVLAERIRSRVAARTYAARDKDAVGVTVSIGVALASRDDRDVSDPIERADRGLYRAKSSGRNRVKLERAGSVSDAA